MRFRRKYALHRNEALHPYFIVGSGRSGSTLLRRLMMTSYRTFIPPETYVLGSMIRGFAGVARRPWPEIVEWAMQQFEQHPQFSTHGVADLEGYASAATSLQPSQRSLASLLDGLYRYLGDCAGIDYLDWGDKTPWNTFFLREIHAVFPHAKFVHVLRDGCDVVVSYMLAGRYHNILDAAGRWMQANKEVLSFRHRHPQLFVTVRYEELVHAHPGVVAELSTFLGLVPRGPGTEPDIASRLGDVNQLDHHRNVLSDVSTHNIGKGRRALTDEQKGSLSPIMDTMLVKLGYPPVAAASGVWSMETSLR